MNTPTSAIADHPDSASSHAQQAPYLLFILLVSICSLLVLAADVVVDANSHTARILRFADIVLCVLFFADFLFCFLQAEHKLKYMLTWGWLDLISSIPAVGLLRWGRTARVVRILRVLRGIRSARILMRFILEKRTESVAMAAALSTVVVITLASIAVVELEKDAGKTANIVTAEDALWWSIVTLATVGYGDRYPVTAEGRLVAAGVMMAGVALVGTWTGIAASWFLANRDENQQQELAALRREVSALRAAIEARLGGPAGGDAE